MRKHLKRAGLLLIVIGAILLGLGGVKHAVGSLYSCGEATRAALVAAESVSVQRTADGVVFIPANPVSGFIFYPGGLVPAEAYAPLLRALAEEGVLGIVPDMPLRLAVLDMDAADGMAEQYPGITRWAIGGHSLGGAMAASYAAGHAEDFSALVLLAAYSTAKLPESLAVVSIYGDQDGVMNREKYAECRVHLPADALEVVIPGGNHAQFGDYGLQKGDGTASISPQMQVEQTVQAILPLLAGE